MSIVYLNIGSNIGNRHELICRAVEKISDIFGYYCLSEFVESEPWGFDSTNRFLNVGMSIKTDMVPERILDILQGIEKEISDISHRDSEGKYKDREIDIDIMTIDDMTYNSERLKLPHPHLKERPFFFIPLQQLNPEWKG